MAFTREFCRTLSGHPRDLELDIEMQLENEDNDFQSTNKFTSED